MLNLLARLRRITRLAPPPSTDEGDGDQTRSVVSEIIEQWPANVPLRVADVLALRPEIAHSRRDLIELAIAEFMSRKEDGASLSARQFAAGFPEIESALLDSLDFEGELENITGLFAHILKRQATPTQWPEPGQEIAGFRLLESLGRGGFSRVFLAEDTEFMGRRVAVKICRSDTHEVRTLADLQHSGIGSVYCVRPVPQRELVAICMPVISRTTLFDVIHALWRSGEARPESDQPIRELVRGRNRLEQQDSSRRPQSFVDWVLEVSIQLARALGASHRSGICHCDLKPSNVLITDECLPVLVDFNVAFRMSASESPANVGGTVPYMAPEQIRAFGTGALIELDARTDLYGLGATLYELLTGRLPFSVEPPTREGVRRMLASRNNPPPRIRTFTPEIDPTFERLILSCLSKHPDHRPVSAEQLADQLEQVRLRHVEQVSGRRVLLLTATAGSISLAVGLACSALLSGTRRAEATAVPDLDPTDVASLTRQAYDHLERGETRQADQLFRGALKLDSSHLGAMLGAIRSSYQLGNRARIRQLVVAMQIQGIVPQNHPLMLALTGLSLAARDEYANAAETFRSARGRTLDSFGLAHNVGQCLFMSARYEQAIQVLQETRSQFGSHPSTNLTLCHALLMTWQQRRPGEKFVDVIQRIDTEQLTQLIEECPEGANRGRIASGLYAGLGVLLGKGQNRPDLWDAWSLKALNEFQTALKHGLLPEYWHGLSKILSPAILQTPEARELSRAPQRIPPRQPWQLYLLDPLADTPFERWEHHGLQS